MFARDVWTRGAWGKEKRKKSTATAVYGGAHVAGRATETDRLPSGATANRNVLRKARYQRSRFVPSTSVHTPPHTTPGRRHYAAAVGTPIDCRSLLRYCAISIPSRDDARCVSCSRGLFLPPPLIAFPPKRTNFRKRFVFTLI